MDNGRPTKRRKRIMEQKSYLKPSSHCQTFPHYQPLVCLVAQSCLTLCNPMECSLPGSSVHGDSPSQNTGVGCHALLQVIFPSQELNPGLPHCRQILYRLSYSGSPYVKNKWLTTHTIWLFWGPTFPTTSLSHSVPFPPAPNTSQHQSLFQ